MGLLSFLTGGIEPIRKLVDNLTTSEEEKLTLRNELAALEFGLSRQILAYEETVVKVKGDIITAEAKANWFTASWRPGLMWLFILILANNYLIGPYLETVFPSIVVTLDFPDLFWNALTVGLGGYVVGRSGEKMVKEWKKE